MKTNTAKYIEQIGHFKLNPMQKKMLDLIESGKYKITIQMTPRSYGHNHFMCIYRKYLQSKKLGKLAMK